MTLKINSLAPDFKAKTTVGDITFHEWLGDSWGVLFSHPKDFTPVCTTELGSLARMKPEFDKRNVKVIGLSVDPVSDHVKWLDDIKDVTGMKPDYPIIADEDLKIAKLYNMLEGDAELLQWVELQLITKQLEQFLLLDQIKELVYS